MKHNKIPPQLHSLIEHIVQGVFREIAKAQAAKKVKEQSTAANAGPVSGPMITKKKKPMEEMGVSSIPRRTNKYVYPENFKAVKNYIRVKRLPDTNEFIVAWYENGQFDEGKTYFTDDMKDAVDTFEHLKSSVDKANSMMSEMTTSAAAGPYSVPGAFTGNNLERDRKHIEVLGYTLTPQGKAELKRHDDKLYENTEPPKQSKPCQNCGHPIPVGKSRCEKCKRFQDDTPEDKKLKYGAQSLDEGKGCSSCNMRVINGVPTHEEGCPADKGQKNRQTRSCPSCSGTVRGGRCLSCNRRVSESNLGPDFDRAQRQYDAQTPSEGDGLECPNCGGTNGYYTQRERSGRYFVWNAECPDCHEQWGDDNLDTD